MLILAIDMGPSKAVFAFGSDQGEENLSVFDTTCAQIRTVLDKPVPTQGGGRVLSASHPGECHSGRVGVPKLVADTTQEACA